MPFAAVEVNFGIVIFLRNVYDMENARQKKIFG